MSQAGLFRSKFISNRKPSYCREMRDAPHLENTKSCPVSTFQKYTLPTKLLRFVVAEMTFEDYSWVIGCDLF